MIKLPCKLLGRYVRTEQYYAKNNMTPFCGEICKVTGDSDASGTVVCVKLANGKIKVINTYWLEFCKKDKRILKMTGIDNLLPVTYNFQFDTVQIGDFPAETLKEFKARVKNIYGKQVEYKHLYVGYTKFIKCIKAYKG